MKRITVLLVEDHMVVREGLRSLLESGGDIEVVGEASNGVDGVQMARRLGPDVVVMDIAMPGLNGLESTERILKLAPAPKILVLSAHGDEGYVERMIGLGVAGYLLKQSSSHDLARAIREVHAGRSFFSPSVAARVRLPNGPVPDPRQAGARRDGCLTSREVEVLQLIAEGKANKQVAGELSISIKTVEKHRQRIMERLNIHNTAGLTRYAVASGIVESSVQVTTLPDSD